MNVHVMVITDGRAGCLEHTLESAGRYLKGPIGSRHIIDDSGSYKYREWLIDAFPAFTVHSFTHKLGFSGAIQEGWKLVPHDATHVFHLEDDFELLELVDLQAMERALQTNENVVQLVLKRQAWNAPEVEAGGIVEMWPDEYEQVDTEHGSYTQHKLFFTTNPSLYRRSLVERGWPDAPYSERKFTERLLEDNPNARFAFWGRKFDPPKVTHIGAIRIGEGY